MSRAERRAWILLVAGALALRLLALGARPPHHDEAVHAHFAQVLLSSGAYRYDPTYHGPLLFYVTAALFAILGEALSTARLYPALAGTALVALPLALRSRLGPRGAWWSGLLLAVSPSFLYYSRFARNDLPVALFTGAALALLLLERRRGWRVIPWIGVAAALHAISKETFYVTLPLLAAAAGATALYRGLGGAVRRSWGWLAARRVPIATGILWFLVITLVAYTFVFVHPGDALFPVTAIRYWHEQHSIERVGGPWSYHLPRLALYEGLIVAAALAWALRRRRRLAPVEVFCLAWGVAAIAMYAYLGEKVPWLLVHQVLPFVPLAGMQLGRTFARGRPWARALAGVGLAATLWSAAAVTYVYPTITTSDPHAELLVFVQTTPEAGDLARRGRELAAGAPAGETAAAVAGEASWPLSWQWRGLPVWWGLPKEGTRPALVVCDLNQEWDVQKALGDGYGRRELPLRGWWVESWSGVTPVDVARWFLTRRAWSPIGATEVVVLERTEGS